MEQAKIEGTGAGCFQNANALKYIKGIGHVAGLEVHDPACPRHQVDEALLRRPQVLEVPDRLLGRLAIGELPMRQEAAEVQAAVRQLEAAAKALLLGRGKARPPRRYLLGCQGAQQVEPRILQAPPPQSGHRPRP